MENNKKSILVYIPALLMIATIIYLVSLGRETYSFALLLFSPFIFPIFTLLGAFGLIVAIKKKSLISRKYFIFLMILSIFFVTYVPAALLVRGIDYVIHFQSEVRKTQNKNQDESMAMQDLVNRLDGHFSNQMTIIDVEKDKIFTTPTDGVSGVFILKVVNAREIGLLKNPNLFIGKKVSVTLSKKDIPNNRWFGYSKEGVALLLRNQSEEEKKFFTDNRALNPTQKVDESALYNYNVIYHGDIPVVIQ